MSLFTSIKFFIHSGIYILVVLVLLHTSFSSILDDDDEIDYDNLDFNMLDPSLISQIDWSRVDFDAIDFLTFQFWEDIPPSFIYRVPANDLDYSQLIVPDQTIEMTPAQIQSNIYNIENLFTDVNSHHVESILLNKFTNNRDLGIRFSIQGDVKLLEEGSLITPRMISKGIEPLNINDNNFIQEVIITDDRRIRVEEIATATETIGGITFAIEDQDPVEPKGIIDELHLGDIQRDIIDSETGEKIPLSNGAVRIEDGRVLISSELGSVTSQEAIITLQSEFPELVGLRANEDGSLSFDSSRLSQSSQARLEATLTNSQNPNQINTVNAPAGEVSSISSNRDFITLRDDVTEVSNARVEGNAEQGYELSGIDGRVTGALNIDENRRTFGADNLQEEDRILAQSLNDGTEALRATQGVQVDIDRNTQHPLTLFGSNTLENLRSPQGGIRLTNTIGSATWESQSRGLIGTPDQSSRVGVTNRGDGLVFTSSTQDNCQGFSNCRITYNSIINGIPTEVIFTTLDSSGDVIFEHFDDTPRSFVNEVTGGGFLRQTFHENEEERYSVDTTSSSVEVRHGFMRDNIDITAVLESGQTHYVTSQESNIQTRVRSEISEFILQNQQGYDTSIFTQNTLQDALKELGLEDTSPSQLRELYQTLFNQEPPLSIQEVERELLDLLSQGSNRAFSNINFEELQATPIGTIFEETQQELGFGSQITQLQVNQEGDGIDPRSLIIPIYASTFETLVVQDTSSLFNQLSNEEQQDVTLVLQQLGVDSPTEQMKSELYRTLTGEYPQDDFSTNQRDSRLLQALKNNEFQIQFNELNEGFQLEAQERGVSLSQVIEESQRDIASYNTILSQSLEQYTDCSQIRGGCSRLVNTGVGLSSQIGLNPQDVENSVLRWAEAFEGAIVNSGGSQEQARQVVIRSLEEGALEIMFSNVELSTLQQQQIIRSVEERS